MAKKKHQSKKHSFKHAEPTLSTSTLVQSPSLSQPSPRATTTVASNAVATRSFAYVTADLRRIMLVGGVLVLAELVLWYLFGHTSLGTNVYNLVHL